MVQCMQRESQTLMRLQNVMGLLSLPELETVVLGAVKCYRTIGHVEDIFPTVNIIGRHGLRDEEVMAGPQQKA